MSSIEYKMEDGCEVKYVVLFRFKTNQAICQDMNTILFK